MHEVCTLTPMNISTYLRTRRFYAFIAALVIVLILTILLLCSSSKHTVTIDTNGDGLADRWAHFDGKNRLVRFEADQNLDGQIDWRDEYLSDESHGTVRIFRSQADLDRNGSLESIVYYDEQQTMSRLERDTNDDGKMDQVTSFTQKDGTALTKSVTVEPGQ